MEKYSQVIFDKNTVEFVTVAAEFCGFLERARDMKRYDFVDTALKILPLLYLKATLLPPCEPIGEDEPETFVTEEDYELIRRAIAGVLGAKDDYLDVYGDSKVFGKNIGGDILCNKKTFMLINALALADGIQRKELEKWIASTAFCPEEKIKAVTALYDKIGIGGICEEKINAYYVEGLSLLESIAVPSERKEELKSFVCHLMNRKV